MPTRSETSETTSIKADLKDIGGRFDMEAHVVITCDRKLKRTDAIRILRLLYPNHVPHHLGLIIE